MEEVAQRVGRVSIAGDTQNPAGHSPEKPAPARPALNTRLG